MGVPEILQLEEFNVSPEGSVGFDVQLVIVPVYVGVIVVIKTFFVKV